MSETEPETASEEQAVETTEASDADTIRARLPADIRGELTKRAFSPGAVRKILRDTYYMGPIAIGTGGWRGIYGSGQPGTGMRRPDGALYNFPRSWRYAALERALNTGLIVHTATGFAATERGVAVLSLIDECPDCEAQREPGIYSTYYSGNPNSEGHLESHDLITYCPNCGGDGYGSAGDSVISNISAFDREDKYVEIATRAISDYPSARTYGGERDISADAASAVPDVDADATESLLDAAVENQSPPTPRELFAAQDVDLYDRPVITIPGSGEFARFRGTTESVAVSKTSTEGDIHITLDSEDRLKVGMSYEIGVEYNVKDMLHYDAEDAEWSGDYWTIGADRLARAVSKLALGYDKEEHSGAAYFPSHDSEPTGEETFFTITVTEDALDAVDTPMLGLTADGDLMD